MTEELKKVIDAELDDALKSGDQARMLRAQIRYFKAMMDCQMKSAERIKRLVAGFDELKARMDKLEEEDKTQNKSIDSLRETQKEFIATKERAKGAAWLFGILRAFAAGGGLAILYRILDVFYK